MRALEEKLAGWREPSSATEQDKQERAERMVREADLAKTIEDENLRTNNAHTFVATAFRDNALRIAGTAITKVLSPVSRFASCGGHDEKKVRVIEKLGASFEPIFGLSVGRSD